jgi:hypothetical protein
MRIFYLGTHMPNWLERVPHDVALFISHNRLRDRTTLPEAGEGGVAIDSGGFTALSRDGEFKTTPEDYVEAIARYKAWFGPLLHFAAPQDHMCEPWIIAKTGSTVEEHQRRTVENFLRLSELWPTVSKEDNPLRPVLQGWTMQDYLRCWDMYEAAGVDLGEYPVVGLGSVCRRQATGEIAHLVSTLRERDPRISLHGFGVKAGGLNRIAHLLNSADSMAWSFRARRQPPLPGCTHASCANCLKYALAWRERILAAVDGPHQLDLFYREEAVA